MNESHGGFFEALFDFSFSEFVTTKIIKFLYALLILIAIAGGIYFIVTFFRSGFLTGLVGLIISPIVVLVYIVGARIWLELVIVMFRIAEYVRDIAERTQETSTTSPSAPPSQTPQW